MGINIIPTSSAEHIGKRLVGEEGLRVIFPDKNKKGERYFSDSEVYTRISRIDELYGRTVLLHSGAPNQNAGLIELEMLLEILDKSECYPIEVFFTYFPYGRQDDIFQPGETNQAENIVREFVDYLNVKRIYVIDAHYGAREWIRKYPIINVSAVGLLKEAASRDYPDAIYLVPDKSATLRTGLKGTEKKRIDPYVTKIESDEEFRTSVRGRTVGAVDDMIETGGTMVPFYDECMKYGAREVIALVTHGVLPEGIKIVQSTYDKLYLTNTICNDAANVDITGLVLNTIKTEV